MIHCDCQKNLKVPTAGEEEPVTRLEKDLGSFLVSKGNSIMCLRIQALRRVRYSLCSVLLIDKPI